MNERLVLALRWAQEKIHDEFHSGGDGADCAMCAQEPPGVALVGEYEGELLEAVRDDVLTRDERLRAEALAVASARHGPGATAETVVREAAMFANYIKAGW